MLLSLPNWRVMVSIEWCDLSPNSVSESATQCRKGSKEREREKKKFVVKGLYSSVGTVWSAVRCLSSLSFGLTVCLFGLMSTRGSLHCPPLHLSTAHVRPSGKLHHWAVETQDCSSAHQLAGWMDGQIDRWRYIKQRYPPLISRFSCSSIQPPQKYVNKLCSRVLANRKQTLFCLSAATTQTGTVAEPTQVHNYSQVEMSRAPACTTWDNSLSCPWQHSEANHSPSKSQSLSSFSCCCNLSLVAAELDTNSHENPPATVIN